MKKVLNNYSSKNDINIKQIVAYKDNILEIEEYFKKMIVNHNKLYIRYVFQSNFLIRFLSIGILVRR